MRVPGVTLRSVDVVKVSSAVEIAVSWQELEDAATQRELAACHGLSQYRKRKATGVPQGGKYNVPQGPEPLTACHRSSAKEAQGVAVGTGTSHVPGGGRSAGQRAHESARSPNPLAALPSHPGLQYIEGKRESTGSTRDIGKVRFLQRAHVSPFFPYPRGKEKANELPRHRDKQKRLQVAYQNEEHGPGTSCSYPGTESDDDSLSETSSSDSGSMFSLSPNSDSDLSWASGTSSSGEGHCQSD